MKILKIFFTFFLFAQCSWVSVQAQDCTFTALQGFAVGCELATTANASGCYQPSCWNAYQTTIRDFSQDCPEYVVGVIEGWNDCTRFPTWKNGRSLPSTGNNIIDPPCDNVYYNSQTGDWECP